MEEASAQKISFWIRLTTVILILLSVAVTYYVIVINRDYTIFSYEDGPDTTLEE